MLKKSVYLTIVLVPVAVAIGGNSEAATPAANIAGQYRCQPLPDSCKNGGNTFTVTQNGTAVTVKNERNESGIGQVTSATSVSLGPWWNMIGIISSDGKTIQWSNGTEWQKQ